MATTLQAESPMYMREKRVLLRHYYLEQGVAKAELARRFRVSRRTIYHWIGTGQLGSGPRRGAGPVSSAPAGRDQARSLQGPHHGSVGRVPGPDGPAAVRRGPRGGLSGRLHAGHRLRPAGPAAAARRTGGALRDAPGLSSKKSSGGFNRSMQQRSPVYQLAWHSPASYVAGC